MAKSISPHQLDARMNGNPSLGAGAIYPVPEEDFVIDPFQIPAWFPRLYGLDVGWKKTAAIWLAHDRDTDIVYAYSEHYRGQAEAPVHAKGIRLRGDWIPGVIDTAARGRSQVDGKTLWKLYEDEGLILHKANKAVEAGLMEVLDRLSTGRLKIFSTLQHTLGELRLYRRDEKGRIVKENDHCLHPDTLVITSEGKQRIRDMVGTKGKVLTIGGKWTEYNNCRLTATDQETVTVIFEDGAKVTCTPDHLFLTADGWVEARDLSGKFCYNAVSQSIEGKSQCKSTSYQEPLKNLKGLATTYAVSITSAMASAFTGLFGGPLTGKKYRTAGTFTISTMIEVITSQITLSLLRPGSTLAITTRAMDGGFQIRPSKGQKHGIGVKPAGAGTNSTMKTTSTSCIRLLITFVNSVAHLFSQIKSSLTGFALTSANLRGAGHQALTTRQGVAAFVRPNLKLTGTRKQKHAQGRVLTKVCRVQSASKSDVYCLTVPETEAFAVESGVVVHNCMDALRYGILKINTAITRPAQQSTNSYLPGDPTAGY
jgi:hypothetical protein